MVFVWVYSFPLGSWFFLWVYVYVFSFKSTFVSFLQSLRLCLPFGFMVFLCSFGFAYTAIRKRRGVLRTKGQGGVVAGKSVSHHHRHSGWQRTELRRVYGDTGMMETDWATGVYGDQGWRRWTE
jgi:hypothetical protein